MSDDYKGHVFDGGKRMIIWIIKSVCNVSLILMI